LAARFPAFIPDVDETGIALNDDMVNMIAGLEVLELAHVALLLKAITAAFPSVSSAWIVAISLPIVVVIEAPPTRPISVLDRAPLAFEDFKQAALRTVDFAVLLI